MGNFYLCTIQQNCGANWLCSFDCVRGTVLTGRRRYLFKLLLPHFHLSCTSILVLLDLISSKPE